MLPESSRPAMRRHDLAWLNAPGWQAAIDAAPSQHRPALEDWRRNGWPAVVRRRDADAGADEVCLGIPLPPDPASGAKVRIGLRSQRSHVAISTPPLPLRAVPLQGELAALDALTRPDATTADISLHVYGSLAMQSLTGLTYVTPASDVDLLFYPTTGAQLDAGLALLAAHAQLIPLDGEIVFPDGGAVSWKEWLQAVANRSRVLVKNLDTVRLADPAQLRAMLEQRA
jgi:phosphoribosyl-dephospho-CoA transferase